MAQTLYVMQGPAGSGKSSVARCLLGAGQSQICSTDDFFKDDSGRYNFLPEKLREFHQRNLDRAKGLMDEGFSVILDNTNIKPWECREYVKHAVKLGISVVFIRVTGNFPNVHGVSPEKVIQQRNSMEDLTLESVLSSKAPWESPT